MSKAKPYLIGAALGASTMFFALQYHVVHSSQGFRVIPRTPQQSIGLAYADVRSWSPSQWTDRPELARALMAHGASDLIADSVATTLADSLSEESSTLDELRSFLNEARESSAAEFDTGVRSQPSDSADDLPGRNSDADAFRIPFPQDVKTKALPDPFRSARIDSDTAPRTTVTDSSPEFARPAFPATGGLKAESSATPAGNPTLDPSGVPRNSAGETRVSDSVGSSAKNRSPRSILEQAQDMEDRIFGKPVPAKDVKSVSPPVSSGSARPSSEVSGESESAFEEITTQLESRAQAALDRARDAAKKQVGTAVEKSSSDAAGFLRTRVQEMIPESVKGAVTGGTSPAEKAAGDIGSFDPFLE